MKSKQLYSACMFLSSILTEPGLIAEQSELPLLKTQTLEYHLVTDSNTQLEDKESEIQISPDEFLNLEDMAQEFVLETKKINIPKYTTAFNPTIVRWHGVLLLCFRIRDPITGTTNQIGFNWLDEDFNLLGETKVLDTRLPIRKTLNKEQDPRLIVIENKLFIIFSNTLDIVEREIRRMHVAEVEYDGDNFFLEYADCLSYFEGEKPQRWEKNWVPFEYQGDLLLAYSIIPHRILRPLLGCESCENVCSSWASLKWDYGQLRGGTAALKVGDEYLAFFHSSKNMQTVHSAGKNIPHYFMGAYTFQARPPFGITKVSSEPIVGKGFYDGPAYKTWKPLRVVFPCGYVHDHQHIWIVYGKQDHEIWVVKLEKKGLLESLVPVNSVVKPR